MIENVDQPGLPGAPAPEISETGKRTSQYVVFAVGDQSICVDIMAVREIRAWGGATPLPNSAEFVLGIVNVRGVAVPIIDLKNRLGFGSTSLKESRVVMIVSIHNKLTGMLVDSVSDILTIEDASIMPLPETGHEVENTYLEGLISRDGEMLAIIDLDRLITKTITH